MIHNEIRCKCDEYNLVIDDPNIAMLCAVLDVRLLGLMNCLPDDSELLSVTVEELKKAGVMNG